MSERITITSALPYANGPVHIGHLAGVYVPADIYARFQRLQNKDVLFIGGSDEHGVPITIRAQKEGISSQEVVDRYHELIKSSFEKLGISFDVYSRTSSETHHETASEFFKDLHADGKFIEKESEQFYDEKNNQFLADRYIMGTCPTCSNEDAYGDQCEKCGSTLSPNELINPKSALSGEVPIKKATKHWYLPLDQYEEWLKEWIIDGHPEWKSNVYGQCKSWLNQGLKPRAVTRDLDWGVPVPAEGAEGKVLYVWFDAPIGYISAAKEWSQSSGKDWKPYWQDDSTKLVHFIGKDNIVFHCIIFPAMLKAHGDYILPDNVPANEFLNLEGDKISTSRNWAVWLHEFLEDFPGKEDVLRYTLTSIAPETSDNDFGWKDFQAKNNNELVAVFGNFVRRVETLIHKYFDGEIPTPGESFDPETEVIKELQSAPGDISKLIEQYKFRDAQKRFMELARAGNKYLADTEPWKVWKEDQERVKTILYFGTQITASLAILAQPFLPVTAIQLKNDLNLGDLDWENAGKSDLVAPGHAINEPGLLFSKVEDEEVETQIEKLLAHKAINAAAEAPSIEKKNTETPAKKNEPTAVQNKEEISFDDFMKLDIRIAEILSAERVPKTDKLLKLEVSVGDEKRTVVSGIAEFYNPEDVVGKKVSLLCNLAPRKIRGIESKGMILMGENNDGELSFISPEKAISSGSTIR